MSILRISTCLCLLLAACAMHPLAMANSEPVNAFDLIIDFPGYEPSGEAYSYQGYVEMLQSLDIPGSDYLGTQVEPTQILLVQYSGENFGAFVEIHEYGKAEDAAREFSVQNPSNYVGKIFTRFKTEEWMVQKDRFLIFLFCYPGDGDPYHDQAKAMVKELLDAFVENLLEKVSVPEKPIVSFQGEVTWGILPGDVITWQVGGSTMYSSEDTEEVQWEIVEISEDNRAVLIRRPQDKFKAIQQPAWADERKLVYTEFLDIPHYEYIWSTADEIGLKFKDGNLMIFPLRRGGQDLKAIAEKQISHLPEKRVTEGAQHITVYGKTSAGMGFTPLKTEWLDMTVHSGTGIVTSYSWYYQDREYDIQTSTSIKLSQTNIPMESRNNYMVPEFGIAATLIPLILGMFRHS